MLSQWQALSPMLLMAAVVNLHVGLTALNNLVEDALKMAAAGIQAVNDASEQTAANYEEGFRILFTFFHDPTPSDYRTIKTRYQDVQGFLNNGVPAGTEKPYLFCSDSWAIRQDMSDQMYSNKGVPETASNGKPYLIKDNRVFVTAQAESTRGYGETTYPYWSKTLGGYVFMPRYGDSPTAGFCGSDPDHQGGTFLRGGLGGVLILCSRSFTGTAIRPAAAAPIDASAFANDKPPTGTRGQRLPDVTPEVATFFHELFHLVWGNALTSPAGGEEYKIRRMLSNQFTKAQALANPETYTQVSVGYDYTIHAPAVNGHPVEFYTGWCTIDQ